MKLISFHSIRTVTILSILSGCTSMPRPIDDAVPKNGVTCFVGEVNSAFTQFSSCDPEVIRKETKSAIGADLIWFKPIYDGTDTTSVSQLNIRRVVSPEEFRKGARDSVQQYRAVFGQGMDKYSDSLHVDDSNCSFSFRIGKSKNVRVWRLTHINIFRGFPGASPETYCATPRKKWEEPRAYLKISTEQVEK